MSRPKPKVWPPLEEWSPFIGWKLPVKHRKAVARLISKHAHATVDENVLDRIERICGAALLRRYLHSKRPLPSGMYEALQPVADLARQLRERLDALAPPVRSEFERRFKAELRTFADGRGVALLGPRPTLETELRLIEATLYKPTKGRPREGWKRVAVRELAEAWTDVTGEAASVKQDPTADPEYGKPRETGPFPEFVRLCFAAIDIKPPTILHYHPKK